MFLISSTLCPFPSFRQAMILFLMLQYVVFCSLSLRLFLIHTSQCPQSFCFPEISKQAFVAAELVVADIVFHGIDSHFEKFPSLFVNVFRYDDFLGYYSVLQIFDMGDVFLRYEPYDVSF